MVCIYCSSSTDVINSRHQKRRNAVWRRRQCRECQAVFTTSEQADLSSTLFIVRSKTVLDPFSRDQLLMSIYDSCKHRQTALGDAIALTATCIAAILAQTTNGSITRPIIIEQTAAVLERFDKTAATMYKAYHRP